MNLTGKIIDRNKYNLAIGIDPGVNTGYAACYKNKMIECVVVTMKVHKALRHVHLNLLGQWEIIVRIEDPTTWKPFKGLNRAVTDSKLQGAGSIKRDFKIWIDFLEDYGIDYETVSLQSNLKKLSADQFKKITGYHERTSSHARDAGMLVYNFLGK